MIAVVAEAVTWDRRTVPATITVTADGVDVVGAPFDAFLVPDGASKLKVTATPTGADFHARTVELIVEPDGTLDPVATDLPAASVASVAAGGVTANRVSVVVSRLLDVSAEACALLADQPATRNGKPVAPITGQGDFPPATWSLPDRTAISFVDPDTPVVGDIVLTAQRDVSGADVECAVFRLAGTGVVPALIAVSWPAALLRDAGAGPTSFLVYYHPAAGQNVPFGFYANNGMPAYPMNFDYAYQILYKYQWYEDDPLLAGRDTKGIPFQLAVAGKQIVSVLPCNKAGGSEFGLFMSAAAVEEILLDLQALMFRRAGLATPPTTLGRTALAAFSSGNHFLAGMVGSAMNRQASFLDDTVREIYLFDPPDTAVDSITATCLAWAGEAADKRIALYTRGAKPAHKKLLGSEPPTPPYVAQNGSNRSAAVIPTETWHKTAVERAGPQPAFDWQEGHQRIAALMLTHAAATSGF